MKKFVLSVAIAIIAMALNGCGSTQPSCDEKEVLETLTDIIKKNLYAGVDAYDNLANSGNPFGELAAQYGKMMGLDKVAKQQREEIDSIKIDYGAFMTTSRDETNKKCLCRASIKISTQSENEEGFITYSAQYTDDGSQVYVEILNAD